LPRWHWQAQRLAPRVEERTAARAATLNDAGGAVCAGLVVGESAPERSGRMASMSSMWMPQRHEDYDTLKGFAVYSSDDEKLGTIKEVCHPQTAMPAARGGHYFRVEPGTLKKLFGGQDEVYVPEALIQRVDPAEDKVILEMPTAQLERQDWRAPRDLDTFRRS
jgi:hypothetical protein